MRTTINSYKSLVLAIVCIFSMSLSLAQSDWPLTLKSGNGTVHVYKPETESFNSNRISFRSAISITSGSDSPVFGLMWGEGSIKTDNAQRIVSITSVSIAEIRFPDGMATSTGSDISATITKGFSDRKPKLPMDDILSDLDNASRESSMSEKMNNNAPKIIYTQTPSLLVSIDGDPMFGSTDVKGVEMVVNTPFLILRNKNVYYLGNGSIWYKSNSVSKGWAYTKSVPSDVVKAAESLSDKNYQVFADEEIQPQIIVTLEPAELVQTDGMPDMSPLKGTNLLYVGNTDNDLFMNIPDGKYYVLLSGRWFNAKRLDGDWAYVSPDKLPSEFYNIAEGSDKDNVMASISGTKAAYDAVRDAQIPQAAMVDRKTAQTNVVYDGSPQFETIEGTEMRYAVNSSNPVIVERNNYYAVDNGVWYVGSSSGGPWAVSDHRPIQVNIIPPSSPVYNVRYVNVYHSTPDVVYVGYTRGYLSGYIVRGTVVYGTGYRYKPWRRDHYFPRPCTWGYGMSYNPWTGWTVGVSFSTGWFEYDYYYDRYPYRYRRGWWGPCVYRPPYCVPYTHYYGNRPAAIRTSGYPRNMTIYPDRAYVPQRNNVYYTSSSRGVTPVRMSSAGITGNNNAYRMSYSRQAQPAVTRNQTTRPAANVGRGEPVKVSARSVPGRGTQGIPPRGQAAGSSVGNSNNNRNGATRPGTGNQSTTRPNTGNQSTTRPNTGNQSTTRPNTGNQSNARPGTGNQSTTRPNTGNQSTTRPNTGNQSTTRPNTGNQSTTRPNTGNQSTTRPNTGNQSNIRPGTENQSTTRPNTGNQSDTRPGTENQSTTRPNTGNQSTTRPNTGNQSNTRSGTENQSTTRPNTGNQSDTRPGTENQSNLRPSSGSNNRESRPPESSGSSTASSSSTGRPAGSQGSTGSQSSSRQGSSGNRSSGGRSGSSSERSGSSSRSSYGSSNNSRSSASSGSSNARGSSSRSNDSNGGSGRSRR